MVFFHRAQKTFLRGKRDRFSAIKGLLLALKKFNSEGWVLVVCRAVFCTACGHVRGNRTRPTRNGRFARPCDARQSRDCLRVAVLRDSPRFRGLRSAAAPIVTAHDTLVEFVALLRPSVSFPFRVLSLPRFWLAICGAMLRRRDTAFLASLASSGQNREPRQAGVTQLDTQAFAPLLTSL